MRIYRWILGVCLGCLVILIPAITLFFGTYVAQWDGPGFRKVVAVVPVPAARIGTSWVLYHDYLEHLDAERKFLQSPGGQVDGMPKLTDKEMRRDALERAIRIRAIEIFAAQRDIVVTPLDVSRAYDSLRIQNGTSTTPAEFHEVLNEQFGWNEQEFKSYFIRPSMLEDGLIKKAAEGTEDATIFTRELEARVNASDVTRYLHFK